MSIYIITHKYINEKPELPKEYEWLYVGAYNQNERRPDYLYDDTGDNISIKNRSYCELTGMYWIWKNTTDQAAGLCHYRRYFVKFDVPYVRFRGRYYTLTEKRSYHFVETYEMDKMLRKNEIIVKESSPSKKAENNFIGILGKGKYDELNEFIKRDYPDFLEDFRRCMQYKTHFHCNMIYAKRDILNKYCTWLFNFLDKFDDYNKKITGECFSNRELGYVGEIILRVWIEKNKIKYKIMPAVNVENPNEIMPWCKIPEILIKKLRGIVECSRRF